MIVVPTFLLPFLLPLLPPLQATAGNATAYWPGDHFCGMERADGRPFRATDTHVAHRRLPLGTPGLACNQLRCVFTTVQDRGPFGAVRPCAETARGRLVRWKGKCHRWRVQTRPHLGWSWRGEFDLTRPVAEALKHRAFERIIFYYWPSKCLTV